MIQIWQVSSECGPSNLVVLALLNKFPFNELKILETLEVKASEATYKTFYSILPGLHPNR